MLRVLVAVCLMGAAGLLAVGGCTPEKNNTWSESADLTGLIIENWSGFYTASSSLDSRFGWMTLYQTGSALTGHDNMRRTWNGTLAPVAQDRVQMEIQTSDGPGGQEVIAAEGIIQPSLLSPDRGIPVFTGVHYASPQSGGIQLIGPETWYTRTPVVIVPAE